MDAIPEQVGVCFFQVAGAVDIATVYFANGPVTNFLSGLGESQRRGREEGEKERRGEKFERFLDGGF